MPLYDLYSVQRYKEISGEIDIFEYDWIEPDTRTQIGMIFEDAIGDSCEHTGDDNLWRKIEEVVGREHARRTLGKGKTAKDRVISAIENAPTLMVLDIIQVCMFIIHEIIPDQHHIEKQRRNIKTDYKDAVVELNTRLRRAGIGYSYEHPNIIRLDNTYLHEEVTKPAIALLHDDRFKGARDEFLEAHNHYKNGEFRDASVDANNALESTMRTICDMKGWDYQKGARATDLIKVIKSNSLFPDYMDRSFDQLVATLQSGLPTLRNNVGGHGQGATPVETPWYVAAYALHLAAAKISFLVNALQESEKS